MQICEVKIYLLLGKGVENLFGRFIKIIVTKIRSERYWISLCYMFLSLKACFSKIFTKGIFFFFNARVNKLCCTVSYTQHNTWFTMDLVKRLHMVLGVMNVHVIHLYQSNSRHVLTLVEYHSVFRKIIHWNEYSKCCRIEVSKHKSLFNNFHLRWSQFVTLHNLQSIYILIFVSKLCHNHRKFISHYRDKSQVVV